MNSNPFYDIKLKGYQIVKNPSKGVHLVALGRGRDKARLFVCFSKRKQTKQTKYIHIIFTNFTTLIIYSMFRHIEGLV